MTRSDATQAHYRAQWGVPGTLIPFTHGPVHELPADFGVLRFPPHGDRRLWTYSTSGISQVGDADALEIHMFSPIETDAIVEVLYVIAHFHRTGAALGLHHTVNFGRPWLHGSKCSHGLISLPCLDGPALESCEITGQPIKFFWLIPITEPELAFKKLRGVEALEEAFDRQSFNYADPSRESTDLPSTNSG